MSEPRPATLSLRGMRPLHEVIGEVGDRIAERGELPVEHRDDLRPARMEDKIVEPEIAMDEADSEAGRGHAPAAIP